MKNFPSKMISYLLCLLSLWLPVVVIFSSHLKSSSLEKINPSRSRVATAELLASFYIRSSIEMIPSILYKA